MKKSAVAFTEHPYDYEDKGGTRVSAEKLGVDEHFARQIGKKRDEPCKPEVAERHSGYQRRRSTWRSRSSARHRAIGQGARIAPDPSRTTAS